MPIYEYQCKNCGEHFEVEQRMIDDPIKIHEKCGGDAVKVFSSAGIVLKGSGFYKTDARSSSKSKKATPKSDESKSSDSGNSDSKSSGDSNKSSSDGKKSGSDSSKTTSSTAPKKSES